MILYHYTSFESLFKILESDELHCSHIDFLNDPTETNYSNSLISEYLNSAKLKHKKMYNDFVNDFSSEDPELDNNNSFIASFSTHSDSLTMWHSYSNGDGCCIGLEINQKDITEFNYGDGKKIDFHCYFEVNLFEIQYNKTKQLEILNNFFEKNITLHNKFIRFSKKILHKNSIQVHEDDVETIEYLFDMSQAFRYGLYYETLGYKHESYQQEKEVRLSMKILFNSDYKKHFKINSRNTIVEYLPINLNLDTTLKSITLHPTCRKEQMLGLEKYIKHNFKNNIEITKSVIPFRVV